jgi:predicted dehydrogenase
MTKIVKAAIVGTGFIGPAHLEALRRLPNVEVTALCEVNLELAKEKAELLGIPHAYTFEDMLKNPDIDVVHICTPNFLHFSQSKAALLAGKHVVCEKPLATKIEEAEELVSLAKEKGLVNAVHFNLRYYPMVRQMKNMRESVNLEMFIILWGLIYRIGFFCKPITIGDWSRTNPETQGP